MSNPKTKSNYPVRICLRAPECPYSGDCDMCFRFELWKKAVAEGKVIEATSKVVNDEQ